MRTNFHTHTNYCDGKHSVEEIVRDAVLQNISQLGFSSHAPLPLPTQWSLLDDQEFEKYVRKEFEYLKYVPIVFISSKFCVGIEELIDLTIEISRLRSFRISTKNLLSILHHRYLPHKPPCFFN